MSALQFRLQLDRLQKLCLDNIEKYNIKNSNLCYEKFEHLTASAADEMWQYLKNVLLPLKWKKQIPQQNNN